MSNQTTRPLHEAFSWVEKGVADEPGADFAALTMNVCRGVETCLQLLHSTDLAIHAQGWGDDCSPVLGRIDKERITLLATAAVQMLGDRAEARVDDANDRARKAAQAGGGA